MTRAYTFLMVSLLYMHASMQGARNELSMKEESLSIGPFLRGGCLRGYARGEQSGQCCYVRIPILRWAILYNLYVLPAQRETGIATLLITTLENKLKQDGVGRIFIQPGPFEAAITLTSEETASRLPRLIGFYEKRGFRRIGSMFLSAMLGFWYALYGMPEDATLLMTKTL